MLHLCDFFRYDRDLYVEMQWENIDQSWWSQYRKNPRTYSFPKYPYDFTSIMHYSLVGGKNGRPSMIVIVK